MSGSFCRQREPQEREAIADIEPGCSSHPVQARGGAGAPSGCFLANGSGPIWSRASGMMPWQGKSLELPMPLCPLRPVMRR